MVELPENLQGSVNLAQDEEVFGWWQAVDVRSARSSSLLMARAGFADQDGYGRLDPTFQPGAGRVVLTSRRLIYLEIAPLPGHENGTWGFGLSRTMHFQPKYELALTALAAPQMQVPRGALLLRVVLVGGVGFQFDSPRGAESLVAALQRVAPLASEGELSFPSPSPLGASGGEAAPGVSSGVPGGGDAESPPPSPGSAPQCPLCKSAMSPESGGWVCQEDGCEVFPKS